MLKAGKIELVKELIEEVKTAKSLVLVNYTGLNVKAQQDLKHKLNAVGGRMIVVKNTLLKRVIESAKVDAGMTGEDILAGQTAVVIAEDDAVAPIQVLGKFAKENELPKFKVGMVDGVFQDAVSLLKISSLPSKDVLLSQVLGALMASEYGLVSVLQGNLQKLVSILDQKSKQK